MPRLGPPIPVGFKATCSVCGLKWAVRMNGEVRAHMAQTGNRSKWCSGTYLK